MITDRFLTSVANFVDANIAKVVINQDVEITDFAIKEVQGNVFTIEYMVKADRVSEVHLIQLKDASNALVSENQVYVPVPSDTILRQTITVREQVGVV
jgi:hypothetical protein